MPDDPINPDPILDTLVRADLDRRADAIDPRALFTRIEGTLAAHSDSATIPAVSRRDSQHRNDELRLGTVGTATRTLRLPVARRVARWGSGISAAAAAIVIAVLLGTQGATPAQASPETILRQARDQAKLPRDRCYLVEMRK